MRQVTAPLDPQGGDGKLATDAPMPALTIIWHPRAHRAGERLLLYPLTTGVDVPISRIDPPFARNASALGEPLDDPYISRKPFILHPLPGGGIRVIAPEKGTHVVCGQTPVNGQLDISAELIARGVSLTLAGRVVLLLHLVEPAAGTTTDPMGMIGESAGIRRVRLHVERVSDLPVPVLIRGETGTGKELVARAIHDKSPRRNKPFVAVSLGSVQKELAMAELFGAAKGAFTGATHDREGLFRAARGGTLFLDELGEAPLDVQAMLLRVLDAGEMYPVGVSTPVAVDVRIIAATDANLEAQIKQDRFKQPLLHRLSTYEIWLTPLRQRREDIGVLVYHFAKEELLAISESHRLHSSDAYADPWLPAKIAALLVNHEWPGNIRELRNTVRKIVLFSRGQAVIQLDPQLEAVLSGASEPSSSGGPRTPRSTPRPAAPPAPKKPRRRPADVPEAELIAALEASRWECKAAADLLGIPRSSIYELMERSANIRQARDLTAEEIERSFHKHGGDLDLMVTELKVSRRSLRRRVNELQLKKRDE